jgi:hypothetical protein
MPITSNNVKDALNNFRALMKPCFIDPTSFTDTAVDIGSVIKIPPKIQDSLNQIKNNGLTENDFIYDPIQIDKINEATYNKITLDAEINTYIPYDKYTLQDIRTAVDSSSSVRSTHREYLSHLIYHYIQLIILSAIDILKTNS